MRCNGCVVATLSNRPAAVTPTRSHDPTPGLSSGHGGAADATHRGMATHNMNEWHDHSGVRWLAPMLAVLAVTIIGILLMVVYPYVSGL